MLKSCLGHEELEQRTETGTSSMKEKQNERDGKTDEEREETGETA